MATILYRLQCVNTCSLLTDPMCTWSEEPGNALRWRHNDHAGVSNHQPHGCLLNRLFRRRSKKASKLRVTGLCAGNSPGPVNSPHKGPVTRKMFPFDDVIMWPWHLGAHGQRPLLSTFMKGQKDEFHLKPTGLDCCVRKKKRHDNEQELSKLATD